MERKEKKLGSALALTLAHRFYHIENTLAFSDGGPQCNDGQSGAQFCFFIPKLTAMTDCGGVSARYEF